MDLNQPLEKILSLNDLNEMTDIISGVLKKPVVVENEQFSLLAYSSYYIEQFDQANQQTIFSKSWTTSILKMFMDEGIVDQLKSMSKPFRVKEMKEIGLNQRVVVSAQYKEQILGYIWVQETEPLLTDHELTFLHDVSFHIGKVLHKKNGLARRRDEKKNDFFKKLIHQSYRTDSEMKWEAAQLNIALPSSFIVAVFTLDSIEEETIDDLHETILLFANTLDQPAHVFTDHLQVTVMLGGTSDVLLSSARVLVRTVKSQFQDHQLYAGIGNSYSSMAMLRKSYLEALEVCRTAQFLHGNGEVPVEYSRLGILRYLETISDYHFKTHYVNEDLLKIRQKDTDGHSELLRTIDVYLMNNCRMKPTAEGLFIHTNTLKYRLNQIDELTSIDFDDFNTRCQLYIDLQLMKRDLH
ncbi:helix-turn-helix domain-containing protein [Domibacillus sp. A3M-37]|uniref:PucR family transcriptional regulator n=1 Tax=Domibacillus sp. A3M-37 TaxID=2962037 RepID=UPI0020B63C01|nr:helix-turn-helix domain-containing protein [Domibacillus sp. A3M-37]MCP3761210.1 helix-turn-helix domain-containing protein [Domibacillus sp. A3M-37]